MATSTSAINTITTTLTNTPLTLMIEKLGLAVANAQAALDRNSINMLQELASSPVRINGNDYNLLTMGFVPTFYAFTEASIEAKLEFAMSESVELKADAEVKVKTQVVSVSVSAGYARKFEQSANGSSSIAARLVSLPPPEQFLALLKSNLKNAEVLLTLITISGATSVKVGDTIQLNVSLEPANATNTELNWTSNDISIATISNTGFLTAVAEGTVTITATAKKQTTLEDKITITIIH